MQKTALNPQSWIEGFNLNQAIMVTGGDRTLYVSGQAATAADGSALHPGDITAQFASAWANLKEVLAAADMQPTNVVRLNIYTTDVEAFMAAAGNIVPIFAVDGCKPTSTLLGVNRLFEPSLMVEIEATAVA